MGVSLDGYLIGETWREEAEQRLGGENQDDE